MRRISIVNGGNRMRDLEVTSYSELVLAPPAADAAHPAFSKLFVQTEYLAKVGAILATRRRRSAADPEIWAAHHAVVEGETLGKPELETDRARFLGRGRDIRQPIAMMDGRRLSNTVGTVLDPVFALRYRVRIPAGATVRIAFWTSIAASRARRSGSRRQTPGRKRLRARGDAGVDPGADTTSPPRHRRRGGRPLSAARGLSCSMLTHRCGHRRIPYAAELAAPAALWTHGISGDLPIVLLRIDDVEDIAIARQLLRAHEYWRMKRLAVDLVILNERTASYLQDLQTALETQLRMSQSRPQLGADNARGSVFLLRTDLISEANARAAVIRRTRRFGRATWQPGRSTRSSGGTRCAGHAASNAQPATRSASARAVPRDLEFFNGLGGFAADGREYVTLLGPGQATPAPWINVIANPGFGFQVAAEGSGFTWALNSRENQLTPWSNDPVTDRPGEVLYLRDEESGEAVGTDGRAASGSAAPTMSPGTGRVIAALSTPRTASSST